MIGAGVLLVGIWGLYAWRFAGSAPSQADGEPPVAHSGPSASAGPIEEAPSPSTSLRAERPPSGVDRGAWAGNAAPPAGLDSPIGETETPSANLPVPITANAPPSSRREIEMTIGRVAPQSRRARAGDELEFARAALARGDLIAARAAFSDALGRPLAAQDLAAARNELGRIAEALLFSRSEVLEDTLTSTHIVGGGETVNVIASRYKVTDALLASINRLANPDRIRVGAPLKVVHGPFRAVIDKSDHLMSLYLGDVFIRAFRVGLGSNGGTPVGTWVVKTKLTNPEWTDPVTGRHYLADDPQNPIGERWISLHGIAGECVGRIGFGIHGTIDPVSIGENYSMGCIRLLPDDVAFVYDLLVTAHSRVIVKE
jgi:LysM repeat protein